MILLIWESIRFHSFVLIRTVNETKKYSQNLLRQKYSRICEPINYKHNDNRFKEIPALRLVFMFMIYCFNGLANNFVSITLICSKSKKKQNWNQILFHLKISFRSYLAEQNKNASGSFLIKISDQQHRYSFESIVSHELRLVQVLVRKISHLKWKTLYPSNHMVEIR